MSSKEEGVGGITMELGEILGMMKMPIFLIVVMALQVYTCQNSSDYTLEIHTVYSFVNYDLF